jgi:adenylate cyclase
LTEGERRLAAIMFTDMVGYTALGQRNESLSLALLEEQRKVIRPTLARHKGKEVKTMGDAFLVEFPTAVDAVRCAYDIQRTIRELNFSLAVDKRVHLRIGVHVGEVVSAEGDISGDAVNVASRIEPLAGDGGVCVTRPVHDFVKGKVDIPLSSLGPMALKNVAEPMEVYQMLMPWGTETAEAPAQLDRKRVAILPFANMSPDPSDEYFADGMTEELIDRLAQVKQLKVIARTSVMSYKRKDKRAADIARELHVGSLVEGSVRKAGNRVRVVVQLIGGEMEEHLWSSHYDGSLDDIFAVQSEIAEKVARELKVQLLREEKETLEKKPTENLEAYADYLRGRELLTTLSEPLVRQALKLFERAAELDPSFARAYVGVGACHQFFGSFGYEQWDAAIIAAKASLMRALELDPDLPEAHASLAGVHFSADDVLGAEWEARKALELNPSLPQGYFFLFNVAGIKGELQEMVELAEEAYRLDPVSLLCIRGLGVAYSMALMESEALELWRKTEALDPAGTYAAMAEYSLYKGDIPKAKEYYAKYEEVQPGAPAAIYLGGFIDAMAGDREKALLAIKKIGDAKRGPIAFPHLAKIYHALGDMDRYFEYLNKAVEGHTMNTIEVRYSPFLAKGREDPRYRELIDKQMRLLRLEK